MSAAMEAPALRNPPNPPDPEPLRNDSRRQTP